MRAHTLTLPLLLALGGCGAEFSVQDNGGFQGDLDGGADTGAQAPGDAADTGLGGGDGLPPEDEVDRLALKPALTDVFVFIAAPERDTVTRVNVQTLEVKTIAVGDRPTVVETLPDQRRAVVLNQGDDSVTILDGTALSGETVDIRDNLNRMALAPGGQWAVLWYDPLADEGDVDLGGAASFNEISLVDLDRRLHVPVVPGFNPKGVAFTPDGALALVVSDASLAVLDLTEDDPIPQVIPIADPLAAPVAEEVVVAPDGARAFVRQRGRDVITVVDLATEDVDEVAVGAGPTDLDLTPDGTEAVVVCRGAKELDILEVDDPLATPRVVPFPDTTPLGSVSIGGDGLALLYTTASNTNRYATWLTSTDVIELKPLPKPVVALSRTPDGSSLLAVHPAADADDGTTPEPYKGKPAVSLISLSDLRANTISLSSPVKAFSNSPDGTLGYVILEDERYLEVLDYQRLLYEEIDIPSVPAFLGVLPDLDTTDADRPAAWISQEHPLGRLSFWDPDDGSLQTLTGFELNSQIEE